MNGFDQVAPDEHPGAVTAPMPLQNRRVLVQPTEMSASDDSAEPGLDLSEISNIFVSVADNAQIKAHLNFACRNKVQASRRLGLILLGLDHVLQFGGADRKPQQRRHSRIV